MSKKKGSARKKKIYISRAGYGDDVIVDMDRLKAGLAVLAAAGGGDERAEEVFQHLLGVARDAAKGGEAAWSAQSTGEKVAVALVFNRFDLLTRVGYTIPQAIESLGPYWTDAIPYVARTVLSGKRIF